MLTHTLQVELPGLWRLAATYFRRSRAQMMVKSRQALQGRLAAEATA